MSTLAFLKEYGSKVVSMYPNLKVPVANLVEMARDEIADGGSEPHEVELAIDAIQELIEESDNG